jgi:peptide/nickel transport system ATP-binding protein
VADTTTTTPETTGVPLLKVNKLKKHFSIQAGFLKVTTGSVRAVDDVSFEIAEGETLGLVGESGCGKTTTARCILRALDPTSGEILFRTEEGAVVDIAKLGKDPLRELRKEMQMVFQDPFTSLNPRMILLDIVGEPLLVHGMKNKRERADRVAELLRLVGLRPEYMQRFPHAFSGGERQRIGIARALALNPRLVVADEPVSALDVSVQAQVINLLEELQENLNLTYLFVAHDLSVVRHIADRVAVMYVGKVAEIGPTEELFNNPKHPYTSALLSSVPIPDPRARAQRIILQGDVANPADPPSGCYFHPRCPHAIEKCVTDTPVLEEISPNHWVSCHRAKELELPGLVAPETDKVSGNGATVSS